MSSQRIFILPFIVRYSVLLPSHGWKWRGACMMRLSMPYSTLSVNTISFCLPTWPIVIIIYNNHHKIYHVKSCRTSGNWICQMQDNSLKVFRCVNKSCISFILMHLLITIIYLSYLPCVCAEQWKALSLLPCLSVSGFEWWENDFPPFI